jgi:hypothetical protein
MATIEDTSNVIDTYGILQPKLNNRWKLEFYQDNQLIEWTQILSNQAIKIHPFSEDFNMSFFGLQLPPDFLTVVFEDDITNQLTKALKSKELLRDNSAKIDLHLLVLNNAAEIVELYVFDNIKIEGIETGTFDYAGRSDDSLKVQSSLKSKSAQFNKVIEKLSDEAQALYHALIGLELVTKADADRKYGRALTKTVTFTYNSLNHNAY